MSRRTPKGGSPSKTSMATEQTPSTYKFQRTFQGEPQRQKAFRFQMKPILRKTTNFNLDEESVEAELKMPTAEVECGFVGPQPTPIEQSSLYAQLIRSKARDTVIQLPGRDEENFAAADAFALTIPPKFIFKKSKRTKQSINPQKSK